MKFLFYLSMLLTLSATAQERPAYLKVSEKYQEYPKNLKYYKAFAQLHTQIPDGALREKILAASFLGARLLKQKREYDKFKAILKSLYPQSSYWKETSTQNLSKECGTCEGAKLSMRKCLTCKGLKNCHNKACKDGKVISLSLGSEKARETKRTCKICEGTGNCVKCEGEGEVKIPCQTCKKKGYVFSYIKGFEKLEEILTSVSNSQQERAKKEFEKTQIAKGLVLYNDEWMTRNERDKLKEAAAEKLKQEEQLAQQESRLKEQKKINLRAETLLKQLDQRLKNDSTTLIPLIEGLIKDHPQSDRIKDLKNALTYCEYYLKARKFEKKGHYEKAVELLSKAQKLRPSEALAKKIQELDNNSIGL